MGGIVGAVEHIAGPDSIKPFKPLSVLIEQVSFADFDRGTMFDCGIDHEKVLHRNHKCYCLLMDA